MDGWANTQLLGETKKILKNWAGDIAQLLLFQRFHSLHLRGSPQPYVTPDPKDVTPYALGTGVL